MTASDREESEVKIPCGDLEGVRSRLVAAGATTRAPIHFESNDLYDDADARLSAGGRALRVRRAAGETILTYKGAARFQGGIKVREERETRVAKGEQLEAILCGLGFSRTFRYEKRREEWMLASCVVALDHTPIGDFVEVEGDPSAIRRAVGMLGLDFSAALPYSYARLYAEKRREDPTLPEDMVFGTRNSGLGTR